MKQQTKDKVAEYVEEYLKCKQNFEYFCRRYVYLELSGGDVLFQPYQKQIELINLVEKEKNVVVLKSRQIGISTIVQAYSCYLLNFFDNTVIGIISKDGKESTDFARAIRGMVEKLPKWLRPKSGKMGESFDKKAEQSFILSNGSKLHVATVNPNAPNKTLRGKAVTFLIIDEAAFINKLDEAFTSLVPALSSARRQAIKTETPYGSIILSTPNKTMGPGAWFFNRYTRALTNDGIFKPFTIHWKEIPEIANDPKWYSQQYQMFDGDHRKIEQELELKFLPAGGSFFEEKTCLSLQEKVIEPIEIFKIFNGEIWKFQEPIPGKYYITGVDTAPEFGDDKSAITVWDYETLEQILEYQTKCKVLDFIKVIKYVCALYPGLIVVENNSYGNQVMEELNNSEFMTMLYKEKRGEIKVAAGLSNNAKTRPLMIDALYTYVSQFPEMVKSKRLALELVGLVHNKHGKVEADSGCHDDLALTLAFAMYVRKYDPPLMIENNKIAQDAFVEIMGLNDDLKKDVTNSSIIKYAKENVFSYTDSFVNTLDIYRR